VATRSTERFQVPLGRETQGRGSASVLRRTGPAGEVSVEFRRVAYDIQIIASAIRQSDLSDKFATDLETGGISEDPNRRLSEAGRVSVATVTRSAGVWLARVISDDGSATIELDPAAFFEYCLELLSASLDAALHSRDRHADSRGCIGLTDAFQIGQRDCLPVRRR
jgi:hypothetical protein